MGDSVAQTPAARAVRVPQAANVGPYDGTQTPPAVEVASSISTEPEMAQLFDLSNGTFIVTGGARGLGLTIAAAIVESGGDVHCCDILPSPSAQEWTALEKKAKLRGAVVAYHRLDVTDAAGVSDCFTQNIAKVCRHPIRGFVSAAATQHEQEAMDYDMAAFARVMRINVDGTMIPAQAAARLMRDSGLGGSIVLIASISGFITNRGLTCTAYNSSKAACHQMCRSVACEWGQYGIRVNTISPGYIRTAMTNMLLADKPALLDRWEDDNPLRRIGMPSELKGPAIFLLSQAASFITGTDIRIDGGHTAW